MKISWCRGYSFHPSGWTHHYTPHKHRSWSSKCNCQGNRATWNSYCPPKHIPASIWCRWSNTHSHTPSIPCNLEQVYHSKCWWLCSGLSLWHTLCNFGHCIQYSWHQTPYNQWWHQLPECSRHRLLAHTHRYKSNTYYCLGIGSSCSESKGGCR